MHPISQPTFYLDNIHLVKQHQAVDNGRAELQNGLNYHYYEGRGRWKEIPDFTSMTHKIQGSIANFDIGIGKPKKVFGMVYEGYIFLEEDGEYTFYTKSDDGNQLYIDDELVVDVPKDKNGEEESGTHQLERGYHAIKVLFFDNHKKHSLEVKYQGPNIIKQDVPDSILFLSAPGGDGELGRIQYEWWTKVKKELIWYLLNDKDYPNHPDGIEFLDTFETPLDWHNDYGARLRGYIHPPVDGEYYFWIAGDEQNELRLSADDNSQNAAIIAYSITATDYREWDKYETQASAPIYLEAGKRYYIEALHKEEKEDDHLSVAWQIPRRCP